MESAQNDIICLNLCERRRNWFRLSYIQKANHLFPISFLFVGEDVFLYMKIGDVWTSLWRSIAWRGEEKNRWTKQEFFLTLRVSVIKSDTDFHNTMIDTSQTHRCGKIISLNACCCYSQKFKLCEKLCFLLADRQYCGYE